MYIDRTAHAANALKAFEKTGAKIPTPVRAALDYSQRIQKFIGDDINANNLPATVLAALKDGKDPATDPDVTAATLAAVWALPAVASNFDRAVETERVQAIVGHADDLIEAMLPAFNKAVQTLLKARMTLGDMDLRDSQAVLRKGGDAPAAWSTAVSAVETITVIMSAWSAIARTAGWPEDMFPLAMVEWDPDKWVATHHEGRAHSVGGDAWEALSNGWTLRLANRSTIAEFKVTILEAEQRARAAAEARKTRHPIFQR